MTTWHKKTTRSRGGWTLLILVLGTLVFSEKALAGETVKFNERESTFYSDLFDQSVYYEGVNQLDLGRWGRKLFGKKVSSKNVNIFDEVPDSGFFTNRQGREKMSLEVLERGYQETAGPDLQEPLEVKAAEQRGIYPRFWVRDHRGDDYLLEFDPQGNPELVTGAELVASRIYHALGYNVPQYTILLVRPEQFRVAPGATTWEDTGFNKALSQQRFEEYLMVLPQNKEGLYRASACKLMKGKYLGPFSFESRRKDDPADVVNHRDRREIRALAIFASWINHFDLGASGTLDVLTQEGGQETTRHYLTDFNGALGSTQSGPKAPMLGHEHQIDYGETLKSVFALGFREKPWQKKWRMAGEKITGAPAEGYFTNDVFDPEHFKTQFPYETFRSVTRADGFWAAKQLLGFSDEDIRAMVRAGQYSDAKNAEVLVKTLSERRDVIVRYWLSRANPLDEFTLSGGKLTFKDLAVERGIASAEATIYQAEVFPPGASKATSKTTSQEPAIDIASDWISGSGEVKLLIRAVRDGSPQKAPAVTISLNASGIQGIRRED